MTQLVEVTLNSKSHLNWDQEFNAPLVTGAICYTDTLRSWHPPSLDARSLKADLRTTDTRFKFVSQRSGWGVLTLYQPPDEALHRLHHLLDPADYFLNRFDSAVDAAFANTVERDIGHHLFHWHHVQRYKRANDTVRFEGESEAVVVKAKPWQMPGERVRLSGWRWQRRRQVIAYPNAHSRITGELDVLHVEQRHYRRRNLLRIGVRTFGDVLGFDHEAACDENWTFFEWDDAKLGKVIHNLELDDNRRAPWVTTNRYGTIVDHDDSHGAWLARRSSVQELLDNYPLDIRKKLKRCLVPLKILRLPWQ